MKTTKQQPKIERITWVITLITFMVFGVLQLSYLLGKTIYHLGF